MKFSLKQKQEIDFLTILYRERQKDFSPTEEEIEEFLLYTSTGKGVEASRREETNRLKIAKRLLDISVKAWTTDMQEGLLYYKEIEEDYNYHPYIVKVLKSVRKKLSPLPFYDGVLGTSILGFLNSKFNIE